MGDRFAIVDMGRKVGGCCAPFRGGAGSPSTTMSSGPRPTSVLSDMGRKLGAAMPISGQLGVHLTQCGLGRGLSPSKWHLDPSNRLATIPQHHI